MPCRRIPLFAPLILGLFAGWLAMFSASALDEPLTPEEALKTFQIEPSVKIELVAAEPLVVSPVALAFDEQGRMYVAEDRGYPVGPGPGQPPAGKIALLEDTNRDGQYDKRTTFAEGLTFPNGVMCWKGGVYVTCAPDLFYLKDTDGDGRADLKQIVFQGFQDLSTTQLRESHPTLNIDNWVYLNCGLTAAKVTSPACPNREPLAVNRLDFRFRPDTCEYEEYSGTGQFGGTFDSLGRRFICSNRNHQQHVVLQARYLRRNPHLYFSEVVQDTPDHGAACKLYPLSHNITTAASHTGFFTSACGLTIYTGRGLPLEYEGNSFTCEPAGNLIHRDIIKPNGATFVAKRASETSEFLASPDNWFRPVNLANGPDGALYICDMYRKTIEHPEYLPEATRQTTDFESGKDKGRIWKVGSALKPPYPRIVNLGNATTKELCYQLDSAEGWWRLTAHRLLLERKDPAAVKHLSTLARSAARSEGRVQALHLLEAMNALSDGQLETALQDKRPPVREHALQLAEKRLAKNVKLSDAVVTLAGDPDPRVRLQCALALGEIKDAKIVPALVMIAKKDGADRWTRAAVLSSLGSHGSGFLEQLIPVATKVARKLYGEENTLLPLLHDLGRTLGADAQQNTLSLLQMTTASKERLDFAWQLPWLSGYADGLRLRQPKTGANSALMSLVDSSDMAPRFGEIMQQATKAAGDEKQPLERRLAAIGLLGHARFSSVGEMLQKLIDPQQPTEIQVAAVRALGTMNDPACGSALVQRERWGAYTSPVKDAALALLLAQPPLVSLLLSALEKGDVSPTTLPPEKRNQLLKSKDEAIRQRAEKLFKNLEPSDRMKAYEEYKAVLSLSPKKKNGHRLFTQTCASCHVYSGEGHTVGPDLTGIRNQPSDVLLLHIIVPEFEIMPIYAQYHVETKDGRSVSGILVSESPASVTLRQGLGLEEKVLRSNIASMTSSRLSLMPQELEKTMSKQDLADLIGYLKGE